MAKIVGIDFGTTYSRISYWDEKSGTPVPIPNLHGRMMTPSVVGLNAIGEVVVGEDAQPREAGNPETAVFHIKRMLDRKSTVALGGNTYLPQAIAAFIMRYLKICAEKHLGEPVHDAVITTPSAFTEVQNGALRDAGQIAGLNIHHLVPDTTASASASGLKSGRAADERRLYAIFNWGGGMLSISVIAFEDDRTTVLSTEGDARLGGLDIDEEISNGILRQILDRCHVDLRSDEAAKRRLRREAESVKKRLSAAETAALDLSGLAPDHGRLLQAPVVFTRNQLEILIRPRLDRSMALLNKAVEQAKKKDGRGWEALGGVLLDGGTSRIPLIRDLMERNFREKSQGPGRPDQPFEIRSVENPDEGTAQGAAKEASVWVPIGRPPEEIEGMTLADGTDAPFASEMAPVVVPAQDVVHVAGHSLGLAIDGSKFHPIIAKDEVIPVTRSIGPFSNAVDNITELVIDLFQGESPFVTANVKLGKVLVINLDPRPRGGHQVNMELRMDADGKLFVLCVDARTRQIYPSLIQYDRSVRLSRDDIRTNRRMVSKALASPPPADKKRS